MSCFINLLSVLNINELFYAVFVHVFVLGSFRGLSYGRVPPSAGTLWVIRSHRCATASNVKEPSRAFTSTCQHQMSDGMNDRMMKRSFLDAFHGVSAAPLRTQERTRGSGCARVTRFCESYPTRIGRRW